MGAWDNFFVAEAGAAAALAGLLFVGVSLNMAKIVAAPALPGRALQALILLLAILIVASLLLVPGLSAAVTGLTLLAVGAVVLASAVRTSAGSLRHVEAAYRRSHAAETGAVVLATALYPATGAALLLGWPPALHLLVPAFLGSFVIAMADAWVLLVEVNR